MQLYFIMLLLFPFSRLITFYSSYSRGRKNGKWDINATIPKAYKIKILYILAFHVRPIRVERTGNNNRDERRRVIEKYDCVCSCAIYYEGKINSP